MALQLQGLCLAEEAIDSSEKANGFIKNCTLSMSRCSSLSSTPSSTNSNNGLVEAHSVINFKSGYDHFMNSSGSLLSFEQNERFSETCFLKSSHYDDYNYPIWGDSLNQNYQNQLNPKCSVNQRVLLGDFNCVQSATGYGSTSTTAVKENQHGGEPFGWLSSEDTDTCIHEFGVEEAGFHKRPHTAGESMQAFKKQCTTSAKGKPKPKSAPSKDPQSIAAKNRRERISERLKILQDLVPNGSKVDLVTMLEKAISYVKFLQLQVKVLATDEFWPVQGGKAPEISQIKEAIDTILLSSQRDRNSSSQSDV